MAQVRLDAAAVAVVVPSQSSLLRLLRLLRLVQRAVLRAARLRLVRLLRLLKLHLWLPAVQGLVPTVAAQSSGRPCAKARRRVPSYEPAESARSRARARSEKPTRAESRRGVTRATIGISKRGSKNRRASSSATPPRETPSSSACSLRWRPRDRARGVETAAMVVVVRVWLSWMTPRDSPRFPRTFDTRGRRANAPRRPRRARSRRAHPSGAKRRSSPRSVLR